MTGTTTGSSPVTEEFGAALAAADLALARAGGSVWELAAAGTAGNSRSVRFRHRRPPGEERASSSSGPVVRSSSRSRTWAGPGGCPFAARRPRPARRDGAGDARVARPDAAGDRRGADAFAVEGRRLWSSGSAGGLSGYARSRRPGARRSRAGTGRHAVPRRLPRRDRGRDRGGAARPARGWERRLHRLRGRVRGRPRGSFLAELVSLQDSIVVAGRPRQDDDGRDDRLLPRRGSAGPGVAHRRRDTHSSAATRGAGEGWLVVEGDESDRTIERSGRRSLSSRTSTSTTTRPSARSPRSSSSSSAGSRRCPQVVRGDELAPFDGQLVGAGRAQPAQRRRCARSARARRRRARGGAARVSPSFEGAGRRLEPAARPGGVRVVDDYAHHPAEIAATLAAVRERRRPRPRRSSSRTSTRAPGTSRASSPQRSRRRTSSPSPTIYPAREEPVAGVSGKLVVDALASAARDAVALDAVRRGRRRVPRAASLGPATCADDRRRRRRPRGALLLEAARVTIEEHVPLSRFTTLGTGGPARWFAQPETVAELVEALAWAAGAGSPRRDVGLGSNLLVADEGVDGARAQARGRARRSARSTGEPARRRRRRAERRLPAPRARGGPRGLRVRLRHPGHGGRRRPDERGRLRRRLGRILERALVVDARRRGWRTPEELGLEYRRSRPRHGQVVARVEFRLAPRPVGRDQGDRRRHAGAAQGRPADEQAHVRQRLQESRARALGRPDARGRAASRATGSAARRSRRGMRTSSRTRAARGPPTRSR